MAVWLVLPDKLTIRLFFDTGIVEDLCERLEGRLVTVFPNREEAKDWESRISTPVLYRSDLLPMHVGAGERVVRRIDRALDHLLGYYPLAIRLNHRHGFHLDRMTAGHPNWMLDSARDSGIPHWGWVERVMKHWHFSPRRYVPHELYQRMRQECDALVLSNVQPHAAVPFLLGARRLGLPIVAHVASWDHTVGKGVIAPFCHDYIVQNDAMRDDLGRYHGIGPERVTVTGWPQTDIYHRRRPRVDYEELVRSLGLDLSAPLVVVMGNTPANTPYERQFIERLLSWWEAEARGRVSLLFRPHPRDRDWKERFRPALETSGVAVQEASFTDFDALVTLLQHCDCVVANAGTILLEALLADRPAVCVLYDEGADPGESFAMKNLLGEHYRELAASEAFYRADRFEEVVAGIERALANPSELASERRRVAREVVGGVDGRAAERVADAIITTVGRAS
ncbi:MAG: UDP-N-acetyl glucosamine 2-epimerase [Thermoleophilia bacterium]|nr:UDP-N-acetyl glucosamine 2-epimerase [Thermoleophilia bacterium]